MLEWVGFCAVRGYSGPTSIEGADLDMNKFMEVVRLEAEKNDGSNQGHPLFKPFMLRRHGDGVGLPENSSLAYDHVSAQWHAFQQLQEGMRILAVGKLRTVDDFHIAVGDTVSIDQPTMGVRRLWLVEGFVETSKGVELMLIDVLGG